MKSFLFYLLFAISWLVSKLPDWILYRISDTLYFIVYFVTGYRKKTVFSNLRTSFPEKQDDEIIRIAKSFYRHFCDFLVETIKGISIKRKNLYRRLKFLNTEIFMELAEKNKSIALVSGHYNNWEMLQCLPCNMPHRSMIIYRPLKNKVMDRITYYMRSRFGAEMIPMENVFREAAKGISKGDLVSVWFLADQRPPRNSKFWTTFLNHETAFFEGVEKIARKLDLAVIFMDIQKVKRGYYQVRLEKLFDSVSGTKENEVLLTCIKKIEDEIVQKPEFWLWSHKRFKHSRPEGAKLVTS